MCPRPGSRITGSGSLAALVSTQQLSLTGRRSQNAAVLLFEQNFLRPKDAQVIVHPMIQASIWNHWRRCDKDWDGGTGQPPLLNTLILVTVLLG